MPGETVPMVGPEAYTTDGGAGADDGKGCDGYARILRTRRQRR